MPPISESTERRILDSISQDEQDTNETQTESTFDSDDTQSDTRSFEAVGQVIITPSSPAYGVFISQLIRYARSVMNA